MIKLAGVSFRIGREPRRQGGASGAAALADQEDNAGMQQRQLPLGLHLDPYRTLDLRVTKVLPLGAARRVELVIEAMTSEDCIAIAFAAVGTGAAPYLRAISSNGLAG